MTNWTELKRLAEIAEEQGDWFGEGSSLYSYYDIEDADFITEATPKTILTLIAENERLREGIKGDYDLDAWLDWAIERAQLRAEVEALRKDADRMEFVAKNSGIYHFREREGKWNCMDCSNGLTFVGKNFSSLREAIDASVERGDHSE